MNKRLTMALIIAVLSVIFVGVYSLSNCNNLHGSDYYSILHKVPEGTTAEIVSMQKGRSEIFPIVGYEDGAGWCLLRLDTEEVFLLDLCNPDYAREVFDRSHLRAQKDISDSELIVMYDSFILLYRGMDDEVTEWLIRIGDKHNITREAADDV